MRQLLVFILVGSVVSLEVKLNNFSKILEPEDSNVLARAVVKVIVDKYVKDTPVINFALASSSTAGKHSILKTIEEVVAGVDANTTEPTNMYTNSCLIVK